MFVCGIFPQCSIHIKMLKTFSRSTCINVFGLVVRLWSGVMELFIALGSQQGGPNSFQSQYPPPPPGHNTSHEKE